MYKINGFVHDHQLTEDELKSNPDFIKIFETTFTPDSYPVLIDENTVYLIHPNSSLVGKKSSEIVTAETKEVLKITKKAIKKDTCARGFYTWIDKEEKYKVICPIIGKTKDGHKLYYIYTMYSRSMPDYYIKTLKNSRLD